MEAKKKSKDEKSKFFCTYLLIGEDKETKVNLNIKFNKYDRNVTIICYLRNEEYS